MNAYLAHAIGNQLQRQFPGRAVIDHVMGWLDVRRAAREERELIAYLRSTDSRVLADAGIDVSRSRRVRPRLAGTHPAVVAMSIMASNPGSGW